MGCDTRTAACGGHVGGSLAESVARTTGREEVVGGLVGEGSGLNLQWYFLI